MKMLTKELIKKLPPLYSQENNPDPTVIVKFFCPWNNWTWYAYEFDGTDIFFGYVKGFEAEYGTFSLSELQSVTGPMGLKIERDLYWDSVPMSKILAGDVS